MSRERRQCRMQSEKIRLSRGRSARGFSVPKSRFKPVLIAGTLRDQLRSLYNICTIVVQYLYNCKRTNIVQVLYIYCTTTGVGMAKMAGRDGG